MISKEKKFELFKDTLDFLGNTITPNGIAPNDLKIEIIVKWKTPQNAKDAMRFMGMYLL